ncbi:hypothetical protein GE107_18960 [Cohnella sp. CFH 77786]|uniref:hypothetical protein n=1 Tax=Cohnella sp. CFH 77786 TaxID=2662265 RepID=UPI001C60CE3C|nr:hypothetical protein [Cohnella sp. CFH 77786]MBW5448142.1 hypothetical protein [Cohnella sp. CFH 77786]
MIRYGDETWTELTFTAFYPRMERRDNQWIDVELRVDTAESTPLPEDLVDFSILAVCTHRGYPMQIEPQDEGCDCEYQLTESEKRQIEDYIASGPVRAMILKAAESGDR